MLRRLLRLLILLLIPLGAVARTTMSRVTGTVVEEESGQPVIQAAVQLLNAVDSSQVDLVSTDMDGRFSIRVPSGYFVLKISYLGCVPQFRNVQGASQGDTDFGLVQMSTEAQMLRAAVIAAKVEPVTISGDTVVYNAAAFRVEEDAMLEDLLRKIPGVGIDAGGNVTLHGKTIRQIYVNGQRFFGGDVRTGLKNMPAEMIDNIKAYDRPSDFSRITGIEDGEEEPVLDLSVKKSMMNGWWGRVNAAGGDGKKANFRTNANKIEKKKSSTLIVNAHNTPGKVSINTTSRSQLGGGSNGDRFFREIGGNFTRKNDKLEISGHLQGGASDRSAHSDNHSESLASSSATTWTNSSSDILSRDRNVKGDLSLEWRPVPGITVYLKPSFSYNRTSSHNSPLSVVFKDDPYGYADDPGSLLGYDSICAELAPIASYSSRNVSQSFKRSAVLNLNAQLTFRSAEKRGRSLTFRGACIFKPSSSWNFYDNDTRYFSSGKTSLRKQYQYYDPSASVRQVQFSFSEPLWKRFALQATIMGCFQESDYNKDIYTFLYTSSNKVKSDPFSMMGLPPEQRWRVGSSYSLDDHLDSLPENYESALDGSLSPKSTYHYNYALTTLTLRYLKKKNLVNVGVQLRPQWTEMEYTLPDGSSDSRSGKTFKMAPFITVKFNRSKSRQIELAYRSFTGAPSLYNLLPIENGTSPTSIHIGNPDLKPSFTQRVNFSYNYSNRLRQNSFVFVAGVSFTEDATANKTTYYPDYERGDVVEHNVKVVEPVNVDGAWKATLSSSLTKTMNDTRFSMNNHLAGEFNRSYSYLYSSDTKTSDLNSVGRLMVKEMFELCFRNDWLELILNGGGEYTEETNSLRPSLNQRPLSLVGGVSTMVSFPWKMKLSSDFSVLSQNGYSFSELNRNYCYWNASVSRNVLKGKGVVKLDMYDILGQQINLTRSFGSSSRSISTYNGVNRYILLGFIYKFKL